MAINFDQDLILVIGASGRTASHILPHLSQKWKRLRLACNSPTSVDRLHKDYPAAEVVQVDLIDATACKSLLKGVTTVFHIGPPYHPRETEIGYNMIDAAVSESEAPGNRFQHFVYSSVLQSCFRKMLNHDRKRYVEEYLMETELNWTIVQPSHMMDAMRPTIQAFSTTNEPELVVTADFSAKTRFTNVTLQDLSEGVARVIDQREKHYFALYPFVSMEMPMTHEEMWEVVGKMLGKPVKMQQQSFDEAVNWVRIRFAKDGGEVPLDVLIAVERTLLFYNRKGLIGNPGVLEMVLGRKTTSYERWVKDIIENETKT